MSIPAIPDAPPVQQFDQIPLRSMGDEAVFEAACNDFWPRVKPFAEGLTATGEWIGTVYTAMGEAYQQTAEAAQTATKKAGEAAGSAQAAGAAAQTAQQAIALLVQGAIVNGDPDPNTAWPSSRIEAELAARGITRWENLTGAAAPPLYTYLNGYWKLTAPVADVALEEPGVSEAWQSDDGAAAAEQEIGEIVYSFQPLDELPDGNYVRAGQTYLQSVYPELFGVIGIGQSVPSIRQGLYYDGDSNSIGVIYNMESFDDETYIAVGASSADNQDRIAYLNLVESSLLKINNATAFDSLPLKYGTGGQCRLLSGDKSLLVLPDQSSGAAGVGGGFYVYRKSGDTFSQEASVRNGRRGVSAINTDNTLICFASPSVSNALELYNFSGGALLNLTANINVNITTGTVVYSVDFRGEFVVVTDNQNGVSLYKVNASRDGLTKISTPSGLASGTTTVRDARLSSDAAYLLVTSASSPYVELYQRTNDTFSSLGGVTGAPSESPNYAVFSDDDQYAGVSFNAISAANRFRLWAVNTRNRVDSLNSNPAQSVQSFCLAPNLRFAFLAEGFDISAYEGFYPFDPDTEFYVPDVADLSPGQVGDWVPSVTGKAYVRAK